MLNLKVETTINSMTHQQKLSMIKNGLLPKECVPKPKKAIAKQSVKKKMAMEAEKELRSGGETELQNWYAAIMKKEEGKCWETGEKIDKNDTFGWHGSVSHILPKEHFPSVMTHPLNYMILKMWGGTHGQYDSSFENASKMKVWPYAVKIINQLYPMLTTEEKARLRNIEVVSQEINPDIFNQ